MGRETACVCIINLIEFGISLESQATYMIMIIMIVICHCTRSEKQRDRGHQHHHDHNHRVGGLEAMLYVTRRSHVGTPVERGGDRQDKLQTI